MKGVIIFLAFLSGIFYCYAQQPKLMLPVGHVGDVYSAVFSPNGKLIATASRDHTAKVWDAATGQLLTELRGHTSDVSSAVFSPDGKWIVTASNDNTAKIWSAVSGKLISDLKGHRGRVNGAVFSPDGKWIVTASSDGTAKVWNAVSGQLTIDLKGHKGEVNRAVFSPDGKWVLTASDDHTAKIWDAASGELITDLKQESAWMKSAAFSPDGKLIVTSSNHRARIWNASSGQPVIDLTAHTRMVNTAVFSPNGKWVLTTSNDQTAKIWNAETGQLITDLRGHNTDLRDAAFSPDGKWVVTIEAFYDTVTHSITAKVWDVATGRLLSNLRGHTNIIRSAVFSPDGKWVVTASDDETAKVWNAVTGQLIADLKGHTEMVYKALFSPGGKWIVTTSSHNAEQVWNATNGKPVANLSGYMTYFSPDGKSVLTVSWNGIKVWNTATMQSIADDLEGSFSNFGTAIFSPDGKLILAATNYNTIGVWKATTGALIANLKGVIDFTHAASFSPDGKWISTALNDGTISVWNAVNGQLIGNYRGDEAAFSPDGKFIATGSLNHKVNVWDIVSGKLLAGFPGDGVLFSPDGKLVATRVLDSFAMYGPSKIWNIQSGKQVSLETGNSKGFDIVEFSSDGKLIMTLSQDGTVKLWNAVNWKLVTNLKGHTEQVERADFSPDGKSIVTTSANHTVSVWNAITGQLIADLGSFRSLLYYPVFSPDGKWIVIKSSGDSLNNWNITQLLDASNGYRLKAIQAGENEKFDDIDFINWRITSRNNSYISIYDIRSGKKLYGTVAIDSTDYLNQIPSGYYLCTPNAAKLLHYVTKDFKVITFAQLDLKYNRPDKVLESIGYPDTALINSYRNVYYKRIKKLGIDTTAFREDYSVPEADFINRDSIHNDQTNETLQFHIYGKDSTYLLDRFNVWINEVPLFGVRGINIKHRNSHSFDTSFTITLSQGSNQIETSITNVNGTESYRMPLLVRYTPQQPKKEKTYFIGIGINRFADHNYNLQWSVKDIRDLAIRLKEKSKGNIEIDTLFDENVSVEKVTALKKKLARSSINDKVIVAYSGHGLLSSDYDYYLSTYNVNFSQPEQNGLPYDELDNLLDSIPARKKLLLIDACHSGEVDKEEMEQYQASKNKLDSIGIQKGVVLINKDSSKVGMKGSVELMQELFVNVGKSTGATIISAAAGTQFALEKNNLKNGVFTYSLLEYMQQHEHATVNELKKYVNQRVTELTAGMQVPTTRNENIELNWEVW